MDISEHNPNDCVQLRVLTASKLHVMADPAVYKVTLVKLMSTYATLEERLVVTLLYIKQCFFVCLSVCLSIYLLFIYGPTTTPSDQAEILHVI